MARRRTARIALACVFICAGAACTLLNPLDEYGPGRPDAGANDAQPDQGPDVGCEKAKWPSRPAKDDSTGEVGELVFAVEQIYAAPPEDAGSRLTTGFDLDGVCTCPEPPSCVAPDGAALACDQPGGIDVGGTEFLSTFIQLAGIDLDINQKLQAGERGLTFRLRHYNGAMDDTRVELAVFLSGGNEGEDIDKPKKPTFDGTDRYLVEPEAVFGGSEAQPPYVPVFVDTNAYVSGGILVSTVDFPLGLSQLQVNLKATVFTARLVKAPADGGKMLYRADDGRIVGRWPTRDMLTTLHHVKDPNNADAGLCGDSGLYQDLKKQICSRVDLVADPKRDNTSAACDSLGVVISFTAGPAQLGKVWERPVRPGRCGPSYSDECVR